MELGNADLSVFAKGVSHGAPESGRHFSWPTSTALLPPPLRGPSVFAPFRFVPRRKLILTDQEHARLKYTKQPLIPSSRLHRRTNWMVREASTYDH
jgi:hypothetical protein